MEVWFYCVVPASRLFVSAASNETKDAMDMISKDTSES